MEVILHGKRATVKGYFQKGNTKMAKVWQGSMMYSIPVHQLIPAK